MNLEHFQSPKEGPSKKVSPAWRFARKANDFVFERVINPVVYPMDAREIRRLAVKKYGKKTVDSGSLNFLDIGSGVGGLGYAVQKQGFNVTCADVENHHAYPRIDFSPIIDGKLPDGTFDVSAFRFVLHHITDPEAALQEAMRVTEGGLIVVHEDIVRKPSDEKAYRDHLTNFNVTYPESTADKTYTDADWRKVFTASGLHVVYHRDVRRIGPRVGHKVYGLEEKKGATVFELGK